MMASFGGWRHCLAMEGGESLGCGGTKLRFGLGFQFATTPFVAVREPWSKRMSITDISDIFQRYYPPYFAMIPDGGVRFQLHTSVIQHQEIARLTEQRQQDKERIDQYKEEVDHYRKQMEQDQETIKLLRQLIPGGLSSTSSWNAGGSRDWTKRFVESVGIELRIDIWYLLSWF
jgi:hypothetical protein